MHTHAHVCTHKMKSTIYKIIHTRICMHTHIHIHICLSAARPWSEGSVWAMARRVKRGRGGDMSDRQNVHTHSRIHAHAHEVQVINDNGKPVRNRFEPKQMVDQKINQH